MPAKWHFLDNLIQKVLWVTRNQIKLVLPETLLVENDWLDESQKQLCRYKLSSWSMVIPQKAGACSDKPWVFIILSGFKQLDGSIIHNCLGSC